MTTSKERPILFSGPMVRAILEGRKTQTRRVVKQHVHDHKDGTLSFTRSHGAWIRVDESQFMNFWDYECPFGGSGDRLWVREAWRRFDGVDECGHADFPCSCPPHGSLLYKASHDDGESKWTPSIHMPRSASRITLLVKAVRVERLQAISGSDAFAEGVDNGCSNPKMGVRYENMQRMAFQDFWDSINAKRPGHTWADNPWVWVVEFEKVPS